METYLHGLLPEEIDSISRQYLKFIPDSLPAAKKPGKIVLVVGAGMAGLVAAGMLKKDHTVYVVEANTRVGGRCKTFRNADGKKYWKEGRPRRSTMAEAPSRSCRRTEPWSRPSPTTRLQRARS